MEIVLLDFVEKALRVAKQALGKHAGKPESGGLPRETHIVAHYIRKEEGHTFTELVDRIGLMPEVCDLLGLHTNALPDPTTFYHSLDRYAMYVGRALLRVSAQQLRRSGNIALDSTFFERKQASQYYTLGPALLNIVGSEAAQDRLIHRISDGDYGGYHVRVYMTSLRIPLPDYLGWDAIEVLAVVPVLYLIELIARRRTNRLLYSHRWVVSSLR